MKTRPRILSLVGLIAAFTIGIDAAPAQAATYETEMVETSGAFGPSSSGWSTKATTTLTSNAPKCIRDRTVKLIAKISGENHVLDVDRSSRNGAVAVYGQRTGSHEAVEMLSLKVAKATHGGDVCADAKDTYHVSSSG